MLQKNMAKYFSHSIAAKMISASEKKNKKNNVHYASL